MLSIIDCHNYAKRKNGVCLSTSYKNNNSKIRWKCALDHEWETTFGYMKNRNSWCPFCSGSRIHVGDLKREFINEGYTPLFLEYNPKSKHLYFLCPNDHKYFITLASWRAGRRCAICAGKRVDIEYIRSHIDKNNYKLCSNYSGSRNKLDLICPKGHSINMSWDNFKQGHRCNRCRGQTSKAEIYLYNYIKKKYNDFEVVHKDRGIIAPYEVDISIPKYNIAIEYNGAGHHIPIYGLSEEDRFENLQRIRMRDAVKREKLRELGWRFWWINDSGAFNSKILDRAIFWLDNNISRVVQLNRSYEALSLDDIGYY